MLKGGGAAASLLLTLNTFHSGAFPMMDRHKKYVAVHTSSQTPRADEEKVTEFINYRSTEFRWRLRRNIR